MSLKLDREVLSEVQRLDCRAHPSLHLSQVDLVKLGSTFMQPQGLIQNAVTMRSGEH